MPTKKQSPPNQLPPPTDKAPNSTERGKLLVSKIKEHGGGHVLVRFKTAAEITQLDDLVSSGDGKNRVDVIKRLVALRHKKLFGDSK